MFTVNFDAYAHKGITFRPATAQDAEQVTAILHAAARPGASAEERATKGFVQGRMGLDGVTSWITADAAHRGAMLAEENGVVVGVLFYSPLPHKLVGPPIVVGIVSAVQSHADLLAEKSLAYGPLAIADSHSGQGLAKALIAAVADQAHKAGFTHIVASVEDANRKSAGMYQHLGAETIGAFERDGRTYAVLAFAL